MELEQQVCSLELAKRLKELGVKQESLFWWEEVVMPYKTFAELVSTPSKGSAKMRVYSAFTVAELGEMLNAKYPAVFVTYREKLIGDLWWVCVSRVAIDPLQENDYQYATTEADARAKMLIYLLENKLIIA